MPEHILHVKGMSCEHCQRKVEDAVRRLDGIRSVGVDLKTGRVKVDAHGDVEESTLRRSIERAGYAVVG